MREIVVGEQFGFWTVLSLGRSEYHRGRTRPIASCECKCGVRKDVKRRSLIIGESTSCGCNRLNKMAAAIRTHGATNTKAYRAWERMRDRCNNPNASGYQHYGGRGIRVCEEWDNFAQFLSHIGPPPSNKHSVDRIDFNGNYEPGNVRWASYYEQSRNRRDTIVTNVDGADMCLKDAAAARRINYGTVKGRLSRGWSIERALNAPMSPPGRPGPRTKTCNPPFNR